MAQYQLDAKKILDKEFHVDLKREFDSYKIEKHRKAA